MERIAGDDKDARDPMPFRHENWGILRTCIPYSCLTWRLFALYAYSRV